MEKNVANQEKNSITKKDFKKLIKELGIVMTKATGEEVKPTYDESQFQLIKKLIEGMVKISEKSEKLKATTLPSDFKFLQGLNLGNEFVQLLGFPDLNEFAKSMTSATDPQAGYLKYIQDPDYVKQRRLAIHQIIHELDGKKVIHEVDELSSSYGEVIFGYTQLAMSLIEELPYLLKERKRFSFVTVSNFLELYKSIISSYVEHMIVFLYGIQQIIRNQFQPYSVISKIRTADKIKSLRKDNLFNSLIGSYRNDIRNSIIHGNQHIDRSSKQVHFIYKKKISLSYGEFVNHVQQITKDAMMIANIKNEINYLTFKNASDVLDSATKN